jgi:hypothetical protein
VRRLQQRQSGGAAARRPQQQQREKQEQQQRFDEAALELDVDEALPPPLSEEELDSIAFSTPLPPLLGDDDAEEEVRHGAGEASTSVVVPARRAGGVSQADREFAQQEVAEVRQRFRAEQEMISATEVEQLHKLRGLLDAMTRHRRHVTSAWHSPMAPLRAARTDVVCGVWCVVCGVWCVVCVRRSRASEDSCEAERSACLECYAKETDDPLACAAKARAFKQCATAPVVLVTPPLNVRPSREKS